MGLIPLHLGTFLWQQSTARTFVVVGTLSGIFTLPLFVTATPKNLVKARLVIPNDIAANFDCFYPERARMGLIPASHLLSALPTLLKVSGFRAYPYGPLGGAPYLFD